MVWFQGFANDNGMTEVFAINNGVVSGLCY